MKVIIQRVSEARVDVAGETQGQIQQGLMVLVGIAPTDTEAVMQRMVQRVVGYRLFADEQGKTNLSLNDINGGLLLVPNFTLMADTRKGMRPSFSCAAPPEQARALFQQMVDYAKTQLPMVQSGVFGADMQLHLCNDGPITISMELEAD